MNKNRDFEDDKEGSVSNEEHHAIQSIMSCVFSPYEYAERMLRKADLLEVFFKTYSGPVAERIFRISRMKKGVRKMKSMDNHRDFYKLPFLQQIFTIVIDIEKGCKIAVKKLDKMEDDNFEYLCETHEMRNENSLNPKLEERMDRYYRKDSALRAAREFISKTGDE